MMKTISIAIIAVTIIIHLVTDATPLGYVIRNEQEQVQLPCVDYWNATDEWLDGDGCYWITGRGKPSERTCEPLSLGAYTTIDGSLSQMLAWENHEVYRDEEEMVIRPSAEQDFGPWRFCGSHPDKGPIAPIRGEEVHVFVTHRRDTIVPTELHKRHLNEVETRLGERSSNAHSVQIRD